LFFVCLFLAPLRLSTAKAAGSAAALAAGSSTVNGAFKGQSVLPAEKASLIWRSQKRPGAKRQMSF
jgi:hypothetical protein